MSGRVVLATVVTAAALFVAAPALGQSSTDGKTVTATGTGQARVHPKNRHSNSSIAAAVDAAHQAAIASALKEAHEYAVDYASAVGLTLGNILSVSDASANGFFGPYGPGGFFGPFGPGRYCGTTRRLLNHPGPGVKPVFKKVHRCIVPPFSYTTLTVTYAAS
jgi:hypothetical protein